MHTNNDEFLYYRPDGTKVYLDNEGNFYVLDNGKKIIFATEEEMKEYFEEAGL